MNKYYIGLEHVGLFTNDAEASLNFYVNKLGFDLVSKEKCVIDGNELLLYFVQAESCVLELVQLPDPAVVEGRSAGIIDHFAIKVKDIDAVAAELKEKGITFETETANDVDIFESGVRSIFFSGPSGERIEFCQHN